MKISSEELMGLIGLPTTDPKLQALFKQFKVKPPTANKEGKAYIGNSETIGYTLIFNDEVIVNQEQFGDIGDGEMIFIAFMIRKAGQAIIPPPYGISYADSYEKIVEKIGKKEKETGAYRSIKSWRVDVNNNILMLSFDFDDDSYQSFYKIQVDYYYGQEGLKWLLD